MKTITFTEQELEFLRDQYQFELEEAENYVESIKSILLKFGVTKPVDSPVNATAEKNGGKRGRKPAAVKDKAVATPGEKGKKERKTRADKGKKRNKRNSKVARAETIAKVVNSLVQATTKPAEPVKAEPVKNVVPKKKTKNRPKRKKGITLTNLKKALPKKEVVEKTPDIILSPPAIPSKL
jgi:hypothetical protein